MVKTTKPFAVFDIDGTVYRSSLYIELINQLLENGALAPKSRNEFALEYQDWLARKGSYMDYVLKLADMFTRQLKGLKVSDLEHASQQVIKNTHLHTYRYTRDLIGRLKKTHFLIAISGSPEPIVKLFAKKYGFNAYSATQFEEKEGVYTKVIQKGYADKDKLLADILAARGLGLKGSIGVGDTADDIVLLEDVENPIAFNPNAELFKTARRKGWKIVIERKDMIYQLKKTGREYRLA